MKTDDQRVFCLGPSLLESAPAWTSGPLWTGDRQLILGCQGILLDPEVQKIGFKLVEEFNERAIKIGIENAIKHGANAEELGKLLGKRK